MTLRSLAVVLCASVALTTQVFQGSGASATTAKDGAQDRNAIETFHARDVAATLSQDPAALAELWTDDVVRLQPGHEATWSRPAVRRSASVRRCFEC